MKIKWTELLICVVGTELVGALSALISGGDFSAFYSTIEKPPFSPPGWIFPVVWGILYALMGVSLYLVSDSNSIERNKAIRLYGAQLIVNFLWAPAFFGLRSLTGAVVIVIALFILVAAMTVIFYRIRKTAAYLNIPYLAWSAFAAYLTVGVFVLQNH